MQSSRHPDLPAQGQIFSACFVCLWWHKSFWFRERMATKKKNEQYDSILNKLGFDANDLIVDQNNQYNKILSEYFTIGFVKYLLESTKTWEEGYQLIKAILFWIRYQIIKLHMAVMDLLEVSLEMTE